MREVSVEYPFTLDEAVTAAVEVTKSVVKFYTFMPWIGGTIMVYCIVSAFLFNRSMSDLIFLAILGLFFAAMPLITRWSAKQRSKKLPGFNRLIKWRINDSELHSVTEGSESRFVWDKIIKVHERKDGFLLFFQPKLAQWLPKHGFKSDTDIELFREIVKSKPIKYKGI